VVAREPLGYTFILTPNTEGCDHKTASSCPDIVPAVTINNRNVFFPRQINAESYTFKLYIQEKH